jgi:TolB protein
MAGIAAPASLEIFLLDERGRAPAAVTAWRSFTTDVSWMPNGLRLLTNSCANVGAICARPELEIFSLALDGGERTRLTNDAIADYDPYPSPDGTKIAWLRHSDPAANGGVGAWGIWMMNADGSDPHPVVDDGNVNSKPAWARDGSAIYFHRLTFPLTRGFSVYRVAPDGSGLAEITAGHPGNNEYPTDG